MHRIPRPLVLVMTVALVLGGCQGKEEPAKDHAQQPAATPAPSSPPAPSPTPAPSPAPDPVATPPGFDVSRVPFVTPQLGRFPYVGLIEGYKRDESGTNKEVAFDRYEFFDGTKIIPVEGRLTTIEAEGTGASAHQVFKTYESLVKQLGGVTVFEGKAEEMEPRKIEFKDMRHRQPVYGGDQMGVYMVRTPEREIWVETYAKEHYGKPENYFLTVVEQKALDVKASLLPADELKKELDTKGHVALYINFDFDKADITPESRPIIDQVVKLLQNNPGLSLTVEGHTDNAGAPDYNQRLSDARARSVVATLTARGIDGRRLKAAGYGQDKPIADNSTDIGRAKNRRVELVKIG